MKLIKNFLLSAALLLAAPAISAEHLIILHTNDTHSQIDPDDKNLGGWFRHKAIIDSVKAANENVIVVDAGDAVQGTLFFNIYKGKVEYKLKEIMGYDYCILGNHDFDYTDTLMAKAIIPTNLKWISSNYEFKNKELAKKFVKYDIKTIADKKIAFLGLNLNPKGMIAQGCYDNTIYHDAIEAAKHLTDSLKNSCAAYIVIAISHLGYQNIKAIGDVDLKKACPNIDIIIGGHSHQLVEIESPCCWHKLGVEPLIVQAFKYGYKLGEFDIDLETMEARHKFYDIDSHYDKYPQDKAMVKFLARFRQGVDSVNSIYISNIKETLREENPELRNFLADFILCRAQEMSGKQKVDLAIINVGSIRKPWIKGKLSEGQVMTTQPFSNRVSIQEISGDSLISCFKYMTIRKGEGVSKNVDIKMSEDHQDYIYAKVNGKNIDPNKTYRIATIDYLANGGDSFDMLEAFPIVKLSENIVQEDLINYIKKHHKKYLKTSDKQRMHY